MQRNDPKVILKGVQNRTRLAAKSGNHDKWLKLDLFAWELLSRIWGRKHSANQ